MTDQRTCPNCGAPLTTQSTHHCEFCGVEIFEQPKPAPPPARSPKRDEAKEKMDREIEQEMRKIRGKGGSSFGDWFDAGRVILGIVGGLVVGIWWLYDQCTSGAKPTAATSAPTHAATTAPTPAPTPAAPPPPGDVIGCTCSRGDVVWQLQHGWASGEPVWQLKDVGRLAVDSTTAPSSVRHAGPVHVGIACDASTVLFVEGQAASGWSREARHAYSAWLAAPAVEPGSGPGCYALVEKNGAVIVPLANGRRATIAIASGKVH